MTIELRHKQISKTNPVKVMLTLLVDGDPVDVDNIDLSKNAARSGFVQKVVSNFPGIDPDDLNKRLLMMAADLAEDDDDEPVMETPLVLSEKALDETDDDLKGAAIDFLANPELIKFIIRHINDMGVVGELSLSLALYLTCTSRLLSNPLAACVMGASSSGKSYAIKTIARLFPSESILQAHKLTPSALQYMEPGALIHRAVIAGERSRNIDDGAAEATRALREMISDGVLRIAMAGKNESGRIVTHHIEQPGPISYIESTTLGGGEIFEEDKTRFLFLCCDESEGQSKAVLSRLAADAMAPRHNEHIESMILLHHTAQRLLKSYDVVIPYAGELIEAIPCRRPEARRAFGHLLNLIKACTLLHQYQRDRDNDGHVVADVRDYDIIREHLSDAIGRGLGVVLSSGAEGLMETIEATYDSDDHFTAAELKELTGLGRVVYDRLKELRQHGYLKMEPGAGNVGGKYQINPLPGGAAGLELPELKNSVYSIPAELAHTNS
jgi:hypothetical protein